MKYSFIVILNILLIFFAKAQVGNSKDIIIKNNVKSSLEKHCFTNSSGSCSVIFEAYDRRGNMTEWNMGRLGTRYKYLYDQKNRKTATIWIDKIDSTKVDTIHFAYDGFDELILEDNNPYPHNSKYNMNSYDQKGRLIKRISSAKKHDNDSLVKAHIFEWTSFDKIKSEHFFTLKKGKEQDTLYSTLKTYEYDVYENLIQEIHYKDRDIVNTICYDYDASLRLIQKKEHDYDRIESANEYKYGGRDDIDVFLTTFTYDAKGRIKEKYTYFSDPCMSLDDHFTYKHFYKRNGLLNKVEASNTHRKIFTITYEYTFY